MAFLSEVWEKSYDKKHQHKAKELLELHGLKYISTPRYSKHRGGGVALVVNLAKFHLEKVELDNPKKVEVVFGILPPKDPKSQIKKHILCSFYFPPKSKKKAALLDFIITSCSHLQTIHGDCGIYICGDRNEMDISPILSFNSSLRQIVSSPTRKDKILDVIITNLHKFYETPIIIPPVDADTPSGSPSDHSVPVAFPIRDANFSRDAIYSIRTFRPLPDSKITEFEEWLNSMSWDNLGSGTSPSEQVEIFQSTLTSKLNEVFPQKKVKLSSNDKPYMTAELKRIDRLKQREYWRFGKSLIYSSLKKVFLDKSKVAAAKYIS